MIEAACSVCPARFARFARFDELARHFAEKHDASAADSVALQFASPADERISFWPVKVEVEEEPRA